MKYTTIEPMVQRHARLFELLRQENVARSARFTSPPPTHADTDTLRLFKDVAERSFDEGRAIL